ncbi:MAG: B12-binding domain-containing radical SAM protein [Candidatus Muiribacteriota bacterium]
MKVLLINQPDKNTIFANNPKILEEERGYSPPLGLLYVAAALKNDNINVKVIDAQVEELTYDELKQRIKEESPDIVGMTLMTFTIFDVKKTALMVKEINSKTKVVLGGPHIYIYPKETLKLPWVDAILIGEGEKISPQFFKAVYSGKDKLKDVAGAGYLDDNNNPVINPPAELIENLDELPMPLRNAVPYKKYNSVIAKRSPITTMFTSRGCPYKCLFCNRPHLGKKFRARSAKSVVEEIKHCYSMGIKEFLIYDDTFTVDKKRVLKICELLINEGLNKSIGFDIRARVNTVDMEMLQLLKEAGCERIHYGVESGTEKILKVLNKEISLDQALRVFRQTKEAGISTLAYFMIGSPEESEADVLKTIDFAIKLDPDYVHITITTPFPDTPLYERALKEGVIEKDVWKEFAENPQKNFVAPHWNREMEDEKLHNLIKGAYKRFYMRPGYILKRILSVSSPSEFFRKAKAGIKLLWMK